MKRLENMEALSLLMYYLAPSALNRSNQTALFNAMCKSQSLWCLGMRHNWPPSGKELQRKEGTSECPGVIPEGKTMRKYRWKIKVALKSEFPLPSVQKGANGFNWVLPCSSVQFSRSVMSDSLRPHDCSSTGFPVHHQLLELAQTHVHSVDDAIQPSVVPFSSSSCLQSFLASGSFQMSQFFSLGGQSIRVSASASVCS